MPRSWTPEMHERLLLCALELGMIDNTKLADLWVKKYEGDGLTPSAIRQHLNKMRSKHDAGATNGAKSGGTPAKKATPRKSAAPKTPTSSMKRKKSSMSDEDDSEDEREIKRSSPTKIPARQRSGRSASKTPKSYAEQPESSGDDSVWSEGHMDRLVAKVKSEMEPMELMDDVPEHHGNFDAMSETSAFDPGADFH